MAVEIRVPPLGESVVEATVGRWTKKQGDQVAKDEVLVELETDKITVEVAAQAAGVLGAIAKQEGETVGVNELLGSLEAAGGASPADQAGLTASAKYEEKPQSDQPVASAPAGEAQTSPAGRALAAEKGIDIASVPGTGPNGRVTHQDVQGAVAGGASAPAQAPAAPAQAAAPVAAPAAAPAPTAPKAAPAAAQAGREERQKMTRRRQTIARRLVESQQTTASLTTFNEVDLKAVMDLRKARQDDFVKKNGVKLGFMSFFTKAVIGALRQFPRLNAEIQGDEIVLKHYYDIGIAVGAEEGLVVPVIRDADRMSFAAIEKTIGELGKRAKDGKLTLEDMQGGTFTITNGGTFGSMLSTPILNPPQVGILGMHNIVERPMVVNGQIEIRPIMYVALTYDHRIVDGSEAVRFLVTVKRMLEDPMSMLLEG
ncbi:2-oxoglutarate dehydrogenase complex dihydrolipoyllysine-residue succinyltransferase [Longimicrobium terrae]|uniref:Dihydrolipoyllysine-residue succinyltransferase component of 2-oxoglutarate dehydrogenase complex n=1 Tax=Longimicrobium terrae TaxID=1639882 RepID=A0A841GY70_9BACT|nr:2-oxoglutarate dehydrogenase complex dihydrolipoyllysine-residue succinyltransferase [Longimicrobium terrae]MBB4636290.1 2-oxoglutarate dehydrogenase E2 component (dihydrolipoamide succinyltransferase) [Longimicrobium terrae]MBB6070686.1 2-oxoglutarate dehydrogenase E2 component (dihydrolipoamide succinyltransferase) [Longimicrobium terrae]NNC29668.1 2-oxoglutarate dehydrogenase complex dihydrolipoyllysine-residue succinyltransferase [Longimicrobium terrae]